MSGILFHYHPVHPTTWAYLSSLLMVGLYFKFGRFWSIRNLDLLFLMLLAPGLLLVTFGSAARQQQSRDQLTTLPQHLESGTPAAPAAAVAPADSPGVPNAEKVLKSSPDAAMAVAVQAGDETTAPHAFHLDGRRIEILGYIWLFVASALLQIRMLVDPALVRRPLLEPNLSVGGMIFIGVSLFVFLMANLVNSPTTYDDLRGPRSAEQLLAGETGGEADNPQALRRQGPGNAVLHLLPHLVTTPQFWQGPTAATPDSRFVRTAKATALMCHLAVICGVIGVGYRHFGSFRTGVGAATLYLMLPYTSLMTGRVNHVLPAAILVWAILCYRRPMVAGGLLGLAVGAIYYPLFLLPLWISFYWKRGLMRFLLGMLTTLSLGVLSLMLVSADLADFAAKVREMFGIWWPESDARNLQGIWQLTWDPVFRRPILAGFVAFSVSFAIWPAQKNLGTLLSCSAAVMVGTQFWHGYGGGLYMAWFLPLVLLAIFRPNLEDRVALNVLGEAWPRRRRPLVRVDQAA